jgi:hypothetical protein
MEEVPGANLYLRTLLLYLTIGGAVALASVSLGVFRFRLLGQILCLLVAIIALWASLIFGVGAAFDAWQAMPEPPNEAYADGAQLTGSIMFGWILAGPPCVFLWACLTVAKTHLKRDSVPA